MKFKKIVGALALSTSLALSFSTNAQIISYDFNNLMESTDIVQTGSLNFFDQSLGTLDSVTLTLTGQSLSSSSITNNSTSNNLNFAFNSGLDFYFDLSSISLTTPQPAFSTVLATTNGVVNLGFGQQLDLGAFSDSNLYSVTLTDVSSLSLFTGNAGESFGIDCFTLTETTFSGGGGNLSATQQTQAACGAEVSYNLTAAPTNQVPEPGTILLLGMGLLGVAGMAKKRKS